MKMNYKQRLTLSFCIILVFFTVTIALFEQYRAKKGRTDALTERLDAYADIIYEYLQQGDTTTVGFNNLLALLPQKLRFTWIDRQGAVLYDNVLPHTAIMENHAGRPEILKANRNGMGADIRMSTTNQQKYLYYAKEFGHCYIRVALPYDIQVQLFLKTNKGFLYFVIAIFIAGLFCINYVAGRFGKSIKQLNDFSVAASNNTLDITHTDFPDDELGEIGRKITQNYVRLKESEKRIALEKEKLLQHVQSSAEGICFFTADWKVDFYNGLFMQYLNTIGENIAANPSKILEEEIFGDISDFLFDETGHRYFETRIIKHGKYFLVRVNVFDDKSFEVVLNDVTKQEKTRKLKQEMTGNIAHELRTPVTSIRGYLETILAQQLDPEKEREFIRKAYNQTLSLSMLIQDMTLLTKIEEAPDTFPSKIIAINEIIYKVTTNMEVALAEQNITVNLAMPDNTLVKGNENLLYALFRNLIDNVIQHAGKNVEIQIKQYDQNNDYNWFSFSDNGVGIADDRHFQRLFERFYRITEGRTRDMGGTGLGLSIVRNAIAFHGGAVTVKNRTGGGLEFLFNLPKA